MAISVGDIIVHFGADLSGLLAGADVAKAAVGGFALAGTAAVVGFAAASVKMAADYQQSMNSVQALTGSTNAQMAQYDAGLKQLAVDAGIAPLELSKGLYNVISAGFQGADAMHVLTLAAEDSKIGMTDMKTTTDALTNVLNTFGLSAKDATRVNGEMLTTVTLGKSTFGEYAVSIVKAASTSKQFGVSMEVMNAAWATMTSSGIKARQATIDYDQSLTTMYAKIGTVTASLHKNGIAFDEVKFNAMSYGDKVIYLNKALEEARAKHVAVTGVTVQAAQAIQTISDHITTYNKNLGILSNAQAMTQKTSQAWAITQSGLNQQLDRLKAAVDVLMIAVGNLLIPILTHMASVATDVVSALTPMVQQISLASTGYDKVTTAVQHTLNVAKPLTDTFDRATGVLSLHAPKVAATATGYQNLGLAQDHVRQVTGPMLDTFDRATGVMSTHAPKVAATATGYQNIWQAQDHVKQATQPMADTFDRANGVLDKHTQHVVAVKKQGYDLLQDAVNTMTGKLKDLIKQVDDLKKSLNDLMTALGPVGGAIKSLAPAFGVTLFYAIYSVITQIQLFIYFLTQMVNSATNSINVLKGEFNGLKDFFTNIWNVISGIFTNNEQKIQSGLQGLGHQAPTIFGNMLRTILAMTTGQLGVIVQQFIQFFPQIVQVFQRLYNQLVGASIVPQMMNAIVQQFTGLPGRIMGALGGMVGQIGGFFNGLANNARIWGWNMVISLVNGIYSAARNLYAALGWLASTIAAYLPHSPAKVGPLADLDRVGPALIQELTSGMMSGSSLLNSTMGNLLSNATVGGAGGGTPTIQIYLDGHQVSGYLAKNMVSGIRSTGPVGRIA